jgi:hypothetical protein
MDSPILFSDHDETPPFDQNSQTSQIPPTTNNHGSGSNQHTKTNNESQYEDELLFDSQLVDDGSYYTIKGNCDLVHSVCYVIEDEPQPNNSRQDLFESQKLDFEKLYFAERNKNNKLKRKLEKYKKRVRNYEKSWKKMKSLVDKQCGQTQDPFSSDSDVE